MIVSATRVEPPNKSSPLNIQLEASDISVMPVCATTNPFLLATVDLNTQVLPIQSSDYFIKSSEKSAGAVPITIMEGLVAKKDLSISSFNLINIINASNESSREVRTVGSTSYILKHPLIISVNSPIEDTILLPEAKTQNIT